jgi:pyridoxine 4-dehydrogenase
VNATPKLKLGETEVARIGLGTNRLTNTRGHVGFVKDAVAAGVSHIDTTHTYTGGGSEQTIGDALSAVSDGYVVATKGGFRAGEGRPETLRAQIEESLRRLRTDSISLYYLHRVDPETPLEESLAVIKEYCDSGNIRHVGLSEVGIDQIERAREIVPITAVQTQYNLSERRYEDVVDTAPPKGSYSCPSTRCAVTAAIRSRKLRNDTARRARRSRLPGCSDARR